MADPRQRRVHDDPPGDPLGKLGGEGVAHHVADVVGHEGGLVDAETVEQARDVPACVFLS